MRHKISLLQWGTRQIFINEAQEKSSSMRHMVSFPQTRKHGYNSHHDLNHWAQVYPLKYPTAANPYTWLWQHTETSQRQHTSCQWRPCFRFVLLNADSKLLVGTMRVISRVTWVPCRYQVQGFLHSKQAWKLSQISLKQAEFVAI